MNTTTFATSTNALAPTNPFAEDRTEPRDEQLVAEALAGSRPALDSLVSRHQRWIYNIAFRMVMTPQDAEDVTQEVLIKILTKLSSYDPSKAAFRTWLYRIVTNHVINMKTRGYEAAMTSLENYYTGILAVPDQDPKASPEMDALAKDLEVGCIMGTLLCLERTQRVAFILAVGFDVTDTMGAEILEMSPDSFRKTLSRARARLHQYMSGNCGVFNPDAPCRCRKKVPGFLQMGAIKEGQLSFIQPSSPSVRQLVGDTISRFESEIYADFVRLHREQPLYAAPDVTAWLGELVERREFKEIFHLN
jgi:RNA polymerase sigma factor (sigma-70 family)